MLERCLARLAGGISNAHSGPRCVFPVIVGRRPHVPAMTLQGKENMANVMNDHHGRGPLISPNTPTVRMGILSDFFYHSYLFNDIYTICPFSI